MGRRFLKEIEFDDTQECKGGGHHPAFELLDREWASQVFRIALMVRCSLAGQALRPKRKSGWGGAHWKGALQGVHMAENTVTEFEAQRLSTVHTRGILIQATINNAIVISRHHYPTTPFVSSVSQPLSLLRPPCQYQSPAIHSPKLLRPRNHPHHPLHQL